ncbi:MAG: glycosidase [Ginsengibacter sp.]
MRTRFEKRVQSLQSSHKELLHKTNKKLESDNGIYSRYSLPVVTTRHTPIFWRFDLNYETNPYMMERFGVKSISSASAIKLNGKYLLIAKLGGLDGQSYFAVAESDNGIDNFEFREYPLSIPEAGEPAWDLQDLSIVHHEDGWVYGLFPIKTKGPPTADNSSNSSRWGIARTIDLKSWERLPDLQCSWFTQKIHLHPEFINGKYAFYLHHTYHSIASGKRVEIELALSDTISDAFIDGETILEQPLHNTLPATNESGPAPIKTQYGWLHLLQTVMSTEKGLHNELHLFMTDLKCPINVIYKPSGAFMAPDPLENNGNFPGNIFSSGWILGEDGMVYIYYGYYDDRLHVVTSTLGQLQDFVMNPSQDIPGPTRQENSLLRIIDNNRALMQLRQAKEKSAH